ncbi:LysR family transcriptional regulator [Sneathiella marina]|uniref:LysR family transcriptional regulator n=1 Tax=Sneathiella marina TaxID=2950108 RepID=A0ABY4W8W9_9PROT|nr:LysR family transcriptional regulator [Sneathiella marina]USG62588.1 LysR family transcriptional regulator [Sneathiella marina]
MNLQQLETFRWVVALGSFTKAARKLNTTQSTISMRISELENELGVQFLDRTKRQVKLTRSGVELLEYATNIHAEVTALKAKVASPETMTGSIKIGAAELVALTWLPDLVAKLSHLFPNIDIELEVGLAGDIREKTVSGDTDLGIVPGDGDFAKGIEAIPLGKIRFAFMASPKLEVRQRELTPKDLEDWPLISLGPNSILSDLQENWFRAHDAQPQKQDRTNSMEVSAGLVRSGLGVSLLPVNYYSEDVQLDRMRILKTKPALPPIPFYSIFATANNSPLIQKTIEIAGQVSETAE